MFLNNYFNLVLNISMDFYQIICFLYLEISTYIFTKSTCLPRSVVDTYV
jgi:hypothetical protein